MGFYRGPNIIRENLLLAFDAANTKSYPGTGTTWTGLGSGVTAALTGATFDTDSISFDGTSDYAYITGTINLGTEFSIMSWIKPSSLTGGTGTVYIPFANGVDNWFGISNAKAFFVGCESSDTNGFSLYGSTSMTSTSEWYCIGCTVDGTGGNTTVKIFLDGEYDGTVTRTFTLGAWNATSFNTIGRRTTINSNYFPGNIATLHMYTSTLSEDDMHQNYMITKSRFK